jgi:hypothetical protein
MDKKLLSDLIDRIISLGEEFNSEIDSLRYYQRPFGERIIESVLSNDAGEIVAEWCRQSGKSSTVATVIPPLLIVTSELAKEELFYGTPIGRFKNGIKVGLFAPTNYQARNLYRKMRQACKNNSSLGTFAASMGISLVSSSEIGLEFSNGSFISVQSAAPTSKVESATFDLVIIDEAQDVETDMTQKSIIPMLADKNGTIVKIGTPKADISDCDFYDSIQRASGNTKNYFRIDYHVVAKEHPKYGVFVESQKARMGEQSEHFQMSFAVMWPKERGMFVTDDCWEGRNEWEGRGIAGAFEFQPEKRTGILAAGIDWAKELGDTIVTIGDIQLNTVSKYDDFVSFTLHIINMLVLHGDDYETQYESVIEFLSNYHVKTMHVDSTKGSVGDPLYDRLCVEPRLAHIDITGVPFVPAEKSRIYKRLQLDMQAGRFKIAGGYRSRASTAYLLAKQEFTKLTKKTTATNLLQVQKNPKDKKAKDDIPDSCCLCLDAAVASMDLEIDQSEDFIFTRPSSRSSVMTPSRDNRRSVILNDLRKKGNWL